MVQEPRRGEEGGTTGYTSYRPGEDRTSIHISEGRSLSFSLSLSLSLSLTLSLCAIILKEPCKFEQEVSVVSVWK